MHEDKEEDGVGKGFTDFPPRGNLGWRTRMRPIMVGMGPHLHPPRCSPSRRDAHPRPCCDAPPMPGMPCPTLAPGVHGMPPPCPHPAPTLPLPTHLPHHYAHLSWGGWDRYPPILAYILTSPTPYILTSRGMARGDVVPSLPAPASQGAAMFLPVSVCD